MKDLKIVNKELNQQCEEQRAELSLKESVCIYTR